MSHTKFTAAENAQITPLTMPTEEEILEKCGYNIVFAYGNGVNDIEGEISSEVSTDKAKQEEVKETKLLEMGEYNQETQTLPVKVESTLEVDDNILTIVSEYNIQFNFPGYSLKDQKLISQHNNIIVPDTFSGKMNYYDYIGSYQYNLELRKDANGAYTKSIFSFSRAANMFSDAIEGSYYVMPEYDADRLVLNLKAQEWIKQPEGYTTDHITISFFGENSHIIQEGYLISTVEEGDRVGVLKLN